MGRAHEVRKVAMAKTAAKKAKLYSRYGKEIYLTAKAGGPELDGNLALRRLVDKAKKEQVPADVIKRAIDKVKSGVTENYEPIQFEGFGPGNSTLIVKCLTDNINRTISQVRPAFTKAKSKLGAEGSVAYLYNVESTVVLSGMSEDEVLEALVMGDVDAKDITTLEDGRIKITGEPTDLNKIKTAIEAKGVDVADNAHIDNYADYVNQIPIGISEIDVNTDTSITGLLKGADGKVAQAVAGEDYAAPVTDTTATLSTTWTGSAAPYIQAVAISGMTADAKIEVGLASTATAEQYAAAAAAQLMCTAQAEGSITMTAYGEKPAVAIPILVRVVG